MRISGVGVLLTGASRGIGRALAWELARRGCRLALVARGLDDLQALEGELRAHGVVVRAFAADVGDGAAMAEVARQAADFLQPWRVVIANAGIGFHGSGIAFVPERWQQLVRVNLLGVWHTVASCFPFLQTPAAIGVVSSLSALLPYRGGGVYAATKSALNAYLRCLQLELPRQACTVGWVCPGPVATDMIVEGIPHSKLPRLARWLVPVLPAEKVARGLVRLLEKGGGEKVMPWLAAFFASFYRHFPRLAGAVLRLSGAGEA